MSEYREDRTIQQLDPIDQVDSGTLFPAMKGGKTVSASAAKIKAFTGGSSGGGGLEVETCTAYRTTDQQWPGSAWYVEWEGAEETGPIMWNSGNPDLITCPPGTRFARVTVNHRYGEGATTGSVGITVLKNQVGWRGMPTQYWRNYIGGSGANMQNVTSPLLPAVHGDTFKLYVYASAAQVRWTLGELFTSMTVEAYQ